MLQENIIEKIGHTIFRQGIPVVFIYTYIKKRSRISVYILCIDHDPAYFLYIRIKHNSYMHIFLKIALFM